MRPERWTALRERIEGAVTPSRRAVLRRFFRGLCIAATVGFGALTALSVYEYLDDCEGLACAGAALGGMIFGGLTVAFALPLVAWAADARNERRDGSRPGGL